MSQVYRIPTAEAEVEIEIKKSRFIATGIPVSSEAEVRAFIERQRAREPGATHHCSAYVIGAPDQPRSAGSNDDGEPTGTAGKPMLNILLSQQVGQCAVVVTRFFGGVKLGAGGLIRAYGAAVKELVAHWPLVEQEPMAELTFRFPYTQQAAVDSILNRAQAQVLASEYGADVALRVECAARNLEQLHSALAERAHLGIAVQAPSV